MLFQGREETLRCTVSGSRGQEEGTGVLALLISGPCWGCTCPKSGDRCVLFTADARGLVPCQAHSRCSVSVGQIK